MRAIDAIAIVLLIVGGLNWGLVAVAEYDLVAEIAGLEFGETNLFSQVVYGLVALSAIWVAVAIPRLTSMETSRRRDVM